MNSPAQPRFDPNNLITDAIALEVAVMAGRLANLLRQRFADDLTPVANSLGFLDYQFAQLDASASLDQQRQRLAQQRSTAGSTPLARLCTRLQLTEMEQDLLILTALAEHHEGFANIFRTLHPGSQPYVTAGLAAQLLCPDEQRAELNRALASGQLVKRKLLTLSGDSPKFARDLLLCDALWPVLLGEDSWPEDISPIPLRTTQAGLQQWLQQPAVHQAKHLIQQNRICTVVLTAEQATAAWQRAMALGEASNRTPVALEWPLKPPQDFAAVLTLHLLARGALPVVRLPFSTESPSGGLNCPLSDFPGSVMLCGNQRLTTPDILRPLFNLQVTALSPKALREMWQTLLPALSSEANWLASRYPLEPSQARQIIQDIEITTHSSPTRDSVAEALRARSAISLGGGVQLVRPVAGWPQLVLPETQAKQLREAVHRLDLQAKVLDDWQFLSSRRGSRGVRMLFSGPPGTGKTLSAEVLANALNVDLLLVDLSQVVSKWIGETEKNLAEVFATAEQARAVLFFDEAESLFGKRTEVNDSHDRYANLETAYLLSRLERFDGLAILASNMRQNIDAAFSRRLEYIIEYEEPGVVQREALWQCHLPGGAPLAEDVNLRALATNFPVVGGLIRNAAVSAAFMAAAEQQKIHQQHFIRAIRREYEKVGKAFREIPLRSAQQGNYPATQ